MTEKLTVYIGQDKFTLPREKIAEICALAESYDSETLQSLADLHECRDVDELMQAYDTMRKLINP